MRKSPTRSEKGTVKSPNEVLTVWVHGLSGRMGRHLQEALSAANPKQLSFVGGSSRTLQNQSKLLSPKALADAMKNSNCIIDFSNPDGNQFLWKALNEPQTVGRLVLIGTTGLSKSQIKFGENVATKNGHTVLFAPNTSLGVLATLQAAKLVERLTHKRDFDIEIVETHHRNKKDAPSGTANFLAHSLAEQSGQSLQLGHKELRKPNTIGVSSVRGGGVFGEHEIRFLSKNEEISVCHRAFDRSLFADGALVLCQWLRQQKVGIYGLSDVTLA